MAGIYVASKTKHASKWKAYREAGFPIISTWIDEAGEGESTSLIDLWIRCVNEAKEAAVLIAYLEEGEVLKGAFIEIGVALAMPRLVLLCGDWDKSGFSFMQHPVVQNCGNINTAMAIGMRADLRAKAIEAAAGGRPNILRPN